MEPFVRSLTKLSLDELNEDVDSTKLESALRSRIRGLSLSDVQVKLSNDRDMLANWLKETAPAGHPAHWILGYLSLPGLANALISSPLQPPRGPTIEFDAPEGWKVQRQPFAINLSRRGLLAVITAVEEVMFGLVEHIIEAGRRAPHMDGAAFELSSVQFGAVAGKKCVFKQSSPAFWKRVDYELSVIGGFVYIMLDAKGKDFDESQFEAKLHTLRILNTRSDQ